MDNEERASPGRLLLVFLIVSSIALAGGTFWLCLAAFKESIAAAVLGAIIVPCLWIWLVKHIAGFKTPVVGEILDDWIRWS